MRKRGARRVHLFAFIVSFFAGAVSTFADGGKAGAGGSAGPIIATKNSKVYHAHMCASAKKIGEANKVHFASRQEAEKSGRRLCRVCAGMDEKGTKTAEGPAEPPAEGGNEPPRMASDPMEFFRANLRGSKEVRIEKAYPGGTLSLDGGDKVRLIGVICPGPGLHVGREFLRFVKEQTRGRTARIEFEQDEKGEPIRDGLGRIVARVVLPGDRDLAAELLFQGIAWHDWATRGPKQSEYLKQEEAAWWSHRGIWERDDGEPGRTTVVIGKHATEYHPANCIHAAHLVEATTVTLNEAKARRLVPCDQFVDPARPTRSARAPGGEHAGSK